MRIPINLSKWKPTRASQAASCKIDFGSTLSFCAEALNSQIYDRRACASAQLLTPLGTQWSCYSYGRFCSGKTITRAFEKLHWQQRRNSIFYCVSSDFRSFYRWCTIHFIIQNETTPCLLYENQYLLLDVLKVGCTLMSNKRTKNLCDT